MRSSQDRGFLGFVVGGLVSRVQDVGFKVNRRGRACKPTPATHTKFKQSLAFPACMRHA